MKKLAGFLVIVCLLCSIPSFGAAFLKIGSIQGESNDAAHHGWIELSSYSWGVTNPAHAAASPAAQACSTGEVRFSTHGSVIVPLQKLVLAGTPLQSVTLDVNGQQHVLEHATMASCQNTSSPQTIQATANCVMKFQRCATHAAAVNAASMLTATPLLATPNGRLLLDSNPADEMTIIAVRPSGPNGAVLVARGSSTLMMHCVTGKHFSKVKISARKAGRPQQEYMTVTLSDVSITSAQVNGDGSVSIGMKYNLADGSLAGFQNLN